MTCEGMTAGLEVNESRECRGTRRVLKRAWTVRWPGVLCEQFAGHQPDRRSDLG
jgi:hypothetical protein